MRLKPKFSTLRSESVMRFFQFKYLHEILKKKSKIVSQQQNVQKNFEKIRPSGFRMRLKKVFIKRCKPVKNDEIIHYYAIST